MNNDVFITEQVRSKFNRKDAVFCSIENDGDPDNNVSADSAADSLEMNGSADEGGSGSLKADNAKLLKDAGQFKSQRDRYKKQLTAAKEEAKKAAGDSESIKTTLGDLYFDPAGLKARIEKLEDFESGALKEAGVDQESLKRQGFNTAKRESQAVINRLEAELKEAQSKVKTLEGDNYQYRVVGRRKNILAQVIKPGYHDAAMAIVERHVREDEDGIERCYDNPDDPNDTPVIGSDFQPVPLEEFLPNLMRQKYKALVAESQAIPNNNPLSPNSKRRNENPFATGNTGAIYTLINADRQRAEAMAKQAGKSLSDYVLT